MCSTYGVKLTSQACVPAWERDPIHTFPVGVGAEVLWTPGGKEEETREEHDLEKQCLFKCRSRLKACPGPGLPLQDQQEADWGKSIGLEAR